MKQPPRRLAETLWTVNFTGNSRPLEVIEVSLGYDFLQGSGYLFIYVAAGRDQTDYSSKAKSFGDKMRKDGWRKSSHLEDRNGRKVYCEEYSLENNFRLRKEYLEDILNLVVSGISASGNLPESVSVQHEYEVRVKVGDTVQWIGEGDLMLIGLLTAVPKQ